MLDIVVELDMVVVPVGIGIVVPVDIDCSLGSLEQVVLVEFVDEVGQKLLNCCSEDFDID